MGTYFFERTNKVVRTLMLPMIICMMVGIYMTYQCHLVIGPILIAIGLVLMGIADYSQHKNPEFSFYVYVDEDSILFDFLDGNQLEVSRDFSVLVEKHNIVLCDHETGSKHRFNYDKELLEFLQKYQLRNF